MSRVVTASEVDRLHAQVAELLQRVSALEQSPATPTELFEDLEADATQETRSDADPVVELLVTGEGSAVPQGWEGSEPQGWKAG